MTLEQIKSRDAYLAGNDLHDEPVAMADRRYLLTALAERDKRIEILSEALQEIVDMPATKYTPQVRIAKAALAKVSSESSP